MIVYRVRYTRAGWYGWATELQIRPAYAAHRLALHPSLVREFGGQRPLDRRDRPPPAWLRLTPNPPLGPIQNRPPLAIVMAGVPLAKLWRWGRRPPQLGRIYDGNYQIGPIIYPGRPDAWGRWWLRPKGTT